MTFEYDGCVFNLLDTPGHEDFSEDTYRTLTAVDSAVMVIDAAKGIEAARASCSRSAACATSRSSPSSTRWTARTRDPFDLLDEIEKTLALDTAPVTWPIGQGARLRRHLRHRAPACAASTEEGRAAGPAGRTIPVIEAMLPGDTARRWREEVELAATAASRSTSQAFREGHLTPVFFGSRAAQFRRARSARGARRIAPPPRAQEAAAHRRGRRAAR
jgi:peptide chain release factor 3